MDVMMLVLDGLAATKQIRACDHPDAKRIPMRKYRRKTEDKRKTLPVVLQTEQGF